MSIYYQGLKDFKQNFTLYIPLSIILQSCIGSIAAMFILMNSNPNFRFFDLSMVVTFAMLYNGSLYAQMKAKWIYNLLILTLLVHITFLIINLALLM